MSAYGSGCVKTNFVLQRRKIESRSFHSRQHHYRIATMCILLLRRLADLMSFYTAWAISGHIGWMRFTSALPLKADITGEKLDRSLKADFWCLLCPLKRTQMGMALDVR